MSSVFRLANNRHSNHSVDIDIKFTMFEMMDYLNKKKNINRKG